MQCVVRRGKGNVETKETADRRQSTAKLDQIKGVAKPPNSGRAGNLGEHLQADAAAPSVHSSRIPLRLCISSCRLVMV